MCSAKDQRSRFDIKVAELRAAQGKNVRMFTDADYHDYVQKVKGDQNTWAQNGSYWLLFDEKVWGYAGGKKWNTLEKLVKPGTTLRYATFESLYDIIKEVHEEGLKHGCRDILNKKLQTMYANISVKQIQAFVDCCEVCQVKKGRMKKGVVVKPIVTSGMNRRCQKV